MYAYYAEGDMASGELAFRGRCGYPLEVVWSPERLRSAVSGLGGFRLDTFGLPGTGVPMGRMYERKEPEKFPR